MNKGHTCEYYLNSYAKPFSIPKGLKITLKQEVDRLIKIGVLKKINNSQWAALTFYYT